MQDADDVTNLLTQWQLGSEPEAESAFFQVVNDKLGEIAHHLLKAESHATMETYDLVANLYLELRRDHSFQVNNRGHFFALCGRLMRRIIVQHARARAADKRGGGEQPVTLIESLDGKSISVVRLHEALEALSGLSDIGRRQAQLIELRFFVGLEVAEAAKALGVHEQTAHRDWRVGKKFLVDYLKQ